MLPENFPFCLFESMEVENKRLITKLRWPYNARRIFDHRKFDNKTGFEKKIPALLL